MTEVSTWQQHVKTVIGTTRPNFLLLSVSVVVLGTALALYQGADWSTSLFLMVVLGAVLAHAAVNMLNEYQDFHSGLDDLTERTPFSGGSGSLQANPGAAIYVKRALNVVLVALILLGMLLVYQTGWGLLPIGLLGLVVILTYTSNITRLPWLCLIAPGLAFGPLMILGTYWVWTGSISWLALTLSLVPFFLVNNLLLLNQYPDLEADKQVGRENIIMRLGPQQGSRVFVLFLGLAFVSLMASIWFFALPTSVYIAMLMLLLAIPLAKLTLSQYQNIQKLMPALAMNVIINLLTPLMMAAGLLWATEF